MNLLVKFASCFSSYLYLPFLYSSSSKLFLLSLYQLQPNQIALCFCLVYLLIISSILSNSLLLLIIICCTWYFKSCVSSNLVSLFSKCYSLLVISQFKILILVLIKFCVSTNISSEFSVSILENFIINFINMFFYVTIIINFFLEFSELYLPKFSQICC